MNNILSPFVLLLLTLWSFSSLGQVDDFNLDSIGNLDYEEGINDIWGYVDSEGTEYAIMGTVEGTAVISLEDPTNPQEVYYVPGANSTWRDMKTYGTYAYITADVGSDGLLIIDMSAADQGVFSHNFWQPTLEVNSSEGVLQTCHNLYIDESGYCYLTGCNLNNGGTLILDLINDPMIPELVGYTPPVYAHDCYADGDRLYTADIYAGQFSVYDVSDKSSPELLARQNTSFRFAHNMWASDDGNYLYTTDERPNAYVDAYDISDLDNIKRLDIFRPESTEGQGVIPHNTHFFDGYLVTSWYTDGLKIIDAHNPDNLVEVGSYDTYDGPSGGYFGCWGAYPFLPSGYILASDRSTGLYVLDPTYVRAAYLEGLVLDSVSGEPIEDATVSIPVENGTETLSDADGEFSTGIAEDGSIEVEFSHPFYETKTVAVSFVREETEQITVELNPLYESYTLSGTVVDEATQEPLSGSRLELKGNITSYELMTDNGGQFSGELFEDTYDIYTGKWGYKEKAATFTLDESESITIELSQGYSDDYVLDLAWTVEGEVVTGAWERAIPQGLLYAGGLATPDADIADDLGEECYVTGAGGERLGDMDVDNGTTRLVSPQMLFSEMKQPTLTYAYWFISIGGNPNIAPDDSLKVSWRSGNEEILLRTYSDTSEYWRHDTIHLDEELPGMTEGQIVFTASDQAATGHVVEAAVDVFRLFDADTTTAIRPPLVQSEELIVYPNPTAHDLNIDAEASSLKATKAVFEIIDIKGRTLARGTWNGTPLQIDKLEAGTYFILLATDEGKRYGSRFIVR